MYINVYNMYMIMLIHLQEYIHSISS